MSGLETKLTRSYHQEDIQQILNLAISRHANNGEFSREQLVEIATELGISTETLQEAEQEWLVHQQQRQRHRDFNLYRQRLLQKQFGRYVITNGFLVSLNLLSAGELSWSLYVLLFWGLGFGLNAWNTYQLQGEEYERAFQKWYRRHQLTTFANSISTRFNNWIKAAS